MPFNNSAHASYYVL